MAEAGQTQFQHIILYLAALPQGDAAVDVRKFRLVQNTSHRRILAHQAHGHAREMLFDELQRLHGIARVAGQNELPNDDALLQHAVFVVHIFARLSHHLMNGSKRRFTVVRRIGKPHGEIVVRIFEIRQVNVDEPL